MRALRKVLRGARRGLRSAPNAPCGDVSFLAPGRLLLDAMSFPTVS